MSVPDVALNNNNNNNTTIPEGTKPDPSDDDLKLLAALEEANRSVLEALVPGSNGRVGGGGGMYFARRSEGRKEKDEEMKITEWRKEREIVEENRYRGEESGDQRIGKE